jgi:hypothetical protein
MDKEKATAIFQPFKMLLNAFINVNDWSKTVNGLGSVIASRVKQILTDPTRNSGQYPCFLCG